MSRPLAPAAIAAVGLVVLLLGIVPSWWFVASTDLELGDPDLGRLEFSFGLTSMDTCVAGRCEEVDYRAVPRPDGAADGLAASEARRFRHFVRAGAATFWGGVLVVLAIGGALLVWSIRQRLPLSPATIGGALAIGVAIASLVTFVVRPDLAQLMFIGGEVELETSAGMPLTLLGCAGCALGGFLLARDEKHYRTLGAPSPAAPLALPIAPAAAGIMTPACPQCHAPTIYVAEHQRHFCSTCRAYL